MPGPPGHAQPVVERQTTGAWRPSGTLDRRWTTPRGSATPRALQSSLFFETPEEIYARVFRETEATRSAARFCAWCSAALANADSFIRLENGRLEVRISDLLAGAPAPVHGALAHILLGKLYRKQCRRSMPTATRLYLNRRDFRRQAHLVRQIRGRKFISGPQGAHHNSKRSSSV